jgi:beta-glucosidase
MFDPPERVPYSRIEQSKLDSAAHRSMARTLAEKSMVLLQTTARFRCET